MCLSFLIFLLTTVDTVFVDKSMWVSLLTWCAVVRGLSWLCLNHSEILICNQISRWLRSLPIFIKLTSKLPDQVIYFDRCCSVVLLLVPDGVIEELRDLFLWSGLCLYADALLTWTESLVHAMDGGVVHGGHIGTTVQLAHLRLIEGEIWSLCGQVVWLGLTSWTGLTCEGCLGVEVDRAKLRCVSVVGCVLWYVVLSEYISLVGCWNLWARSVWHANIMVFKLVNQWYSLTDFLLMGWVLLRHGHMDRAHQKVTLVRLWCHLFTCVAIWHWLKKTSFEMRSKHLKSVDVFDTVFLDVIVLKGEEFWVVTVGLLFSA